MSTNQETQNWVEEFYSLNPDAKVEEVKKAKKENTLPLSQELLAMDTRNFDFYDSLTDQQKKDMSIWVLMRFMSSSQSESIHHILAVNDFVNHNFNSLSKHPELQWKLLALCGTGKKQFHAWIAPPKGIKKNKIEEALLSLKPLLKDSDLELLLRINSKEELIQFFADNGFDDKTLKDLFKDSENKK